MQIQSLPPEAVPQPMETNALGLTEDIGGNAASGSPGSLRMTRYCWVYDICPRMYDY
jgi:hypothetical protein